MDGSIKLRKGILEWKWWRKPEMVSLLIYFVSSANTENTVWRGRDIMRGQLVTSRSRILKDNPALTDRMIRTCISRLQEEGLIKVEASKGCTIITIRKFESYQVEVAQDAPTDTDPQEKQEKPETQEEQQPPKPKRTHDEIVADYYKRKQKFYDSLVPYVEVYGKEMVRQFYNYWKEPNKSFTKMRWEQEKTWSLNLRLARWANHTNIKSNGTEKKREEKQQRLESYGAVAAKWRQKRNSSEVADCGQPDADIPR